MKAGDFTVNVSAASELPEEWTPSTTVEATFVNQTSDAQRSIRCRVSDLRKLRRGVLSMPLRRQLADTYDR